MLDVSDGIAVDAGHLARALGRALRVELDRVPLAAGATVDDLGFGEDYELLAAVDDPGGFPVVGRVEAGAGVARARRRRAVRAPRLGALRARAPGYRYDSNASRKCAAGRAPMTVSLASPCSNRITVGIDSTS